MDNLDLSLEKDELPPYDKRRWTETSFDQCRIDTPTLKDAQKKKSHFSGKECCRKALKIFFSHVGTLTMVIVYMVMGGFLFQYLELDNEKNVCVQRYMEFEAKLNESEKRTVAIVQVGKSANENETSILVRKELEKFASEVFTLSVDPSRICSTIGQPGNPPSWSTINSMYFCATIVSTIGYGHIAPNTKWGKIICMIYSILGIPIMLLFLTNIGEVMAVIFKAMYLNICCCRCFIKKTKEVKKGHVDEAKEWKNIADTGTNVTRPSPPEKITIFEEEYEEDYDENLVIDIPITVILLVLAAYIMIGATLFRIWELDWNMVDGAYFSFITLSTIGFGDLVLGKGRLENPSTSVELVVGSFYCLFGLAILSMCLNLIQDEITAKFRWLSTKLGFDETADKTNCACNENNEEFKMEFENNVEVSA